MIPRKVMYETDKQKLLDHFINEIKGEDRYLRFGATMNDEFIKSYIDRALSDFGKTNMWFMIEDGDRVVGTVHVNITAGVGEMGFTVSPDYRGKGCGQQLFYRGSTWASMKGAKTIYTHCLSQNKVMQHIAKKNDMTIITLDEGEREASVKVTKSVLKSYYEDATMDQMAFVDHSIRKQQNLILSYMKL